ncbi:MAG: hypothetical protein J2P50_12135 [Hyphomicrobiaceae bacterium]|nr:hypothetical protein [Hyphomicrobiaceae bacterium]
MVGLAQGEQRVITSGPYRFVRNPGYTVGMALFVGIPLALASWWALASRIGINQQDQGAVAALINGSIASQRIIGSPRHARRRDWCRARPRPTCRRSRLPAIQAREPRDGDGLRAADRGGSPSHRTRASGLLAWPCPMEQRHDLPRMQSFPWGRS